LCDIAFIKSLPDAENITYFFQGEHIAQIKQMAIPLRLMVKKYEAEKVIEIIKDVKLAFTVGSFPDEQDGEESGDNCTKHVKTFTIEGILLVALTSESRKWQRYQQYTGTQGVPDFDGFSPCSSAPPYLRYW
jgi:hypothetical protein